MNIGNKLIHMGINRQVYLLPLFTWYNEKIKINRTYCLAHYRTYLAIAAAAAITAATSAAIPGGIAAAIQQQSQSRPQSQPQPHSAIMDKHLTAVSFHFLSNIRNSSLTLN